MSIPELHDPDTFREFLPKDDPFLIALEAESREEDVPIIGPHVGMFLYLLVKISGARRILELGTANGYSTIWIAKALSGSMIGRDVEGSKGDGVEGRNVDVLVGRESEVKTGELPEGQAFGNEKPIVTLEWEKDMAEVARGNIERAGYSMLVKIIQGDARTAVGSMKEGSFDLIFLDVEKEFYSEFLDPSIRLLRSGGVMFFDNTAFTTAGDFLERSFNHPQLETLHMYGLLPNHGPDYDALTLCVKK